MIGRLFQEAFTEHGITIPTVSDKFLLHVSQQVLQNHCHCGKLTGLSAPVATPNSHRKRGEMKEQTFESIAHTWRYLVLDCDDQKHRLAAFESKEVWNWRLLLLPGHRHTLI
jgi:hypothetical protein